MPALATEEERELMLLEQQKAAVEARAMARQRGKGKRVTERLVEQAMIKARDEAHDRHHARLLQEQASGQAAEEAELVPVQAMMPAGVVKRMMEKESERG